MKVEYRNIEILVPYARNARTHSDEQISQVAASIKEFGFNDPIAADGDNGIIEGHARVLAAKQLGMETVPVIELSHLSDIQKRAYILAHNKLTENAGWDQGLLAVEIGELQAAGIEDLTGFGADEIDALMNNKTLLDIYNEDGTGHTSRQEPFNALIISIGSFVHYANREIINFDTFREQSGKAQEKNDNEKMEIATKIASYALELFE